MRATRIALLLATVLITAVVPAASAGRCAPLMTDPAGDSSYGGTGDALRPVEDGRLTDLLSVDLASDSKELVVRIRTTGRKAEGGTAYLDHLWYLHFATSTTRFHLAATSDRLAGQTFGLYEVVAGEEVPDEQEGSGSSVGTGVDTTVTGTVDEVAGRIDIRVPLSAFAPYGGLGKELRPLRASAYSGLSTGVFAEYTNTDLAATRKAFRVGSRGCP